MSVENSYTSIDRDVWLLVASVAVLFESATLLYGAMMSVVIDAVAAGRHTVR